jgi:predicted nucleotidyltransferase
MKAKTFKHTKRQTRVVFPKERVADFCRRNHIVKLSLFGSRLRGDFRRDSDVDVLVELDQGHVPGFFRLARMERELSELLGRKQVDLRTPQDLSRYFRDDIVRTAKVQYERV